MYIEGYRIGGVFRPIYRTPPFHEGKLLFPLGEYGVKNCPKDLEIAEKGMCVAEDLVETIAPYARAHAEKLAQAVSRE